MNILDTPNCISNLKESTRFRQFLGRLQNVAEKVVRQMGIMSQMEAGSMFMARATFGYQGIKIGVIVEAVEDIEWLTEFLVPWFSISDQSPDISVRVSTSPERFESQMKCGSAGNLLNAFMMDTNCIKFPEWNVSGHSTAMFDKKHGVFYLVSPDRIELLCAASQARIRVCLMRVLRELAMGSSQLTGGRFVHASAFVAGGKAAIITGPRNAGKTSLLSYMLATTGSQFLSNDRLLINVDDAALEARGMPTIVSIREGTMDMIPGLRRTLGKSGFSSSLTLQEAHDLGPLNEFPSREGRHGISPRQFCTALDCDPIQRAPASALVFPRQTGSSGTIDMHRLEPGKVRKRLEECLFGNIGPRRLSQAFTFTPPGLHGGCVMSDGSLLDRLARALPGFDCELGQEAFASDAGAESIMRLLSGGLPQH